MARTVGRWLAASTLMFALAASGQSRTDVPIEGVDTRANPGDGFYAYANGRWLSSAAVPDGHSEIGALQSAVDGLDARMRALLDGANAAPADSSAGKLAAYYHEYNDTATRDRLGLTYLEPLLHEIAGAPDRRALAALMGRQQTDFTGSLTDVYVGVDHANGRRYAVFLGQSGLGLPDRANYIDKGFAHQRYAYLAYLRFVLAEARVADPARAADDVLRFENAIARASWSDDRQVAGAERRMDRMALIRLAPGIDWARFLDSAGIDSRATLIVSEPGATGALAALFARTPLATLRAWMTARTMDRAAPFLASPLVGEWQRFHEQTIMGATGNMPAWQRAVRVVAGMQCVGSGGPTSDCFGSLRWAAGDLYLKTWFPTNTRDIATAMIGELRGAFRKRLANETWMAPATRKEALRKLDAYTVKVGGPSRPTDLSGLIIHGDDLVDDARAVASLDWAAQRGRLRQPVDPAAWVEAPQTVDANNGDALDIEFPAGLFQPPVYDADRDAAYNFGALGAFIGHELTHGFDNEGRHVDADNRRRDWWLPADDKAFSQRARALSRQYDAWQALPGLHVHGDQTLGEDIADLGGLSVALDAYHASLGGKPAPVVDGFTGDQRVLLGWAWLWRGKMSPDALRQQVASAEHPPYAARVDVVVRNMDAWYDAFDVRPGNRSYLAPASRVHLW